MYPSSTIERFWLIREELPDYETEPFEPKTRLRQKKAKAPKRRGREPKTVKTENVAKREQGNAIKKTGPGGKRIK